MEFLYNTTILNYQVRTIFRTFNFNFDHNSRTPYVSYINRSSNDHTAGVVLLLVYITPRRVVIILRDIGEQSASQSSLNLNVA